MPEDRIGLGKVLFPSSTEKDLRVALDDFATKVDDNLNYILPAVISHTGPAGATGATGPQGPAGADGADGSDGIFSAIASQSEAEEGTENTKGMTALRTAQAIAAQASAQVGLGDWASKSADTSYLASTDGFVVCTGAVNNTVEIKSDASNPPTTDRVNFTAVSGVRHSATIPVKKGHYWKITAATFEWIYWIPLGS